MAIPLIKALGRQGKVNLCESETSLGYKTARATQRIPVSKTKDKVNYIDYILAIIHTCVCMCVCIYACIC